MKAFSKSLIGFTAALLAFSSCSKEFDVPPIERSSNFKGTVTHTIAELKSQFNGTLDSIGYYVAIKGIVTADDESQNLYKKIVIQDETGAIELSIDQNSIYTQLPIGQEVYIECQGLFIGKYGGLSQLGYKYKNATSGAYQIGRMPAEFVTTHIFVNGNPTNKVTPTEVAISDLTPGMMDMLVTFKDIRFTNGGTQTFSTKGSTYPVSQEIKDVKGNKIVAYTSSYANFALDTLPKGNGSITGIISYYNGTWQLLIRDKKDIGTFDGKDEIPSGDIPVYNGTATHTLAAFKTAYNSDLLQITDNAIIKGTVVSSDETGNVFKKLYIQDETGGIEVNISATSLYKKYAVGQEIFIECKGLYVGKYGGVLQIGALYNGKIGQMDETTANSHIFLNNTPKVLTPQVITIPTLSADLIDKLVILENVSFVNGGTNNYVSNATNTSEQIKDAAGNTIVVYTNKYASFANTLLPSGNVNITGILSSFNGTWQLILNRTNDVVQK